MEPVYYVSYYLESQKQLAASKGSSQKPLLDVPADQELNSLRPGQALVGVAVAGLDKLLDGDGRDGGGGDEVDHRLRLADIGGFDIEARRLERAEELFDDPT